MNDSPPLPSALLKVYAACAKWSLRILAAAWLLLVLAWAALHLWIVPRIDDMRPLLETRVSRALGVPVRIGAVSARTTGLIPTLELQSVVLLDPHGREALRLSRVLAAPSPRSLWNLGFEQLVIEGPEVEMRRLADGRVLVAGLDVFASGTEGRAADWVFSQREFVVLRGTLHWIDEVTGAPPLALVGVDLVMRNSARRHAMRLEASPPPAWGERFTLQGVFRQPLLSARPGRWQEWDGQLHADLRHVDLRELRRHAQPHWQVDGGHGAVRAWVDVARGQVVGAVADVALADVSTRLGADLPPLQLASLSGRLGARQRERGFELETRELQFATADGHHWPQGNLFVSWEPEEGKRAQAGELRADRLDLAMLGTLAGHLPLGDAVHGALARFAPRGVVDNLQARWQGPLQSPQKYQVRGRASGIQVAAGRRHGAHAATPGVRNASVEFDANENGGKARVALDAGALELPGVFDDPVLPFDRLSADLQWQLGAGRLAVTASSLRFANADAEGQAQASWRSGEDPAHRFPGVLDLEGTLSRANGTRIWRYLPLAVPRETRQYVRDAVQQGEASDAKFRVKGALADFPFGAGQGEFRLTAQVRNATYAYAPRAARGQPGWPALSQVSGRLVLERSGMRLEDATGRFAAVPGLRFRADADIADLNQPLVKVNGEVKGPLPEALALVQRSPISALLQDALARAVGSGPIDLRLKLGLPLAQIERSTVEGSLALLGNDVQITPDSPALARVRGTVAFTDRGFSMAGVQARALGGDVRLDGGTRGSPTESAVVVRAQGTASADALRQARELGAVARLARHASGAAAYVANLTFRKGMPEVQVSSTLQGLALDLPAPFGKAADAPLPFRYENTLLRDAQGALTTTDQLVVELGRAAFVHYLRDTAGAEPRVLRGAVAVGLGPGEVAALPEQGVTANVRLGSLDVDAWERVLEGMGLSGAGALPRVAAAGTPPAAGASAAGAGYLPTVFALRARELTVEGRTLHHIVVGGSREGQLWRGNVDAEELNGYVEYRQPAGAGAGRVHARLARLSIAAGAATAVETLLDQQPVNIPALDVVVEDFELRGRKLGRLEIDATNRGGGAVVREGGIREWRLNKLSLTVPEGSFTATGNWAAVDAQAVAPGGPRPARTPGERRRTVMNFRLDIADGGQLLARLGMKEVVRRGQGRMEGQVAWLGSPLAFDYPSMTGAFHVSVENGQFLKADPGLAKLLGVLSLQSLPRRLALDFRDVFSQGFQFDFLRGDIAVQQGVAATNNLQMKGVNAAVLMEGKADLARETQDIRVVVVPEINAGTASLVAAAINPAIGLGTFLAQIFLREPLARAATQQFQIDGTWADPRVTKLGRTAAETRPETRSAGNN